MVRTCIEADVQATTEIYRHHVLHGLASFETEPPSEGEMAARIETASRSHAWLVLEDEGRVVGYAYGGRRDGGAAGDVRQARQDAVALRPAHAEGGHPDVRRAP